MAAYAEMRQKLKKLRDQAEEQRRNFWNRKEHHLAVSKGLSEVLCKIDTAEADNGRLTEERDLLSEKRKRAVELLTQAIMHLEAVGYLDGSGGQALQLARFARRELEP